MEVVAPALDQPVVQNCTGVPVSSCNGNGGSSCTKVNGCEVVAHFVCVITYGRGVSNAQLAVAVSAPALDQPVVQEGA